jgi:hypothetical protein
MQRLLIYKFGERKLKLNIQDPVMSNETKYTFSVPAEPLSSEFLQDIQRQFTDLGFVRRAAYVMLGADGELSYLIFMDLEVPPEKVQEACQLVAQSIKFNAKVPYDGKWSLDFGLWDPQVLIPILGQEPSLEFFRSGH